MEDPKILFDDKKNLLLIPKQKRYTKKTPIILECYSSKKKTFLVYFNLQCCYENPCTLLRRIILRPA